MPFFVSQIFLRKVLNFRKTEMCERTLDDEYVCKNFTSIYGKQMIFAIMNVQNVPLMFFQRIEAFFSFSVSSDLAYLTSFWFFFTEI